MYEIFFRFIKKISFLTDNTSRKNLNDVIEITKQNNYDILRKLKINNFDKLFASFSENIDTLNKKYKEFTIDKLTQKVNHNINYKVALQECNNFPSFNSKNVLNDKYPNYILNQLENINIKITYKLKLTKININLFFYTNKNSVEYEKHNEIARIIYMFCLTFLDDLNFLNQFNFRFLLIDFPRKLDSELDFNTHSDLGMFNNSSGFTNISKKELVVSRNSGLNGLLIHELIHLLNLDFFDRSLNLRKFEQIEKSTKNNWINNTNIVKCSNNVIGCIHHFTITETICNSLSSFLLSVYNGIKFNYIKKDNNKIVSIDKIIAACKLFYIVEYLYCFINCIKILKYFEYGNYDTFFNNTSNRKFYQNAHVFEYSILRIFAITNLYELIVKNILEEKYEKSFITKKINDNLLEIMKSNKIRDFYDLVLKYYLNSNKISDSVEYFCINI